MATEKRLIDANALKDKFLYLRKMWSETEIILTINDAKTVDAVEVVRCKDCKHRTLCFFGKSCCSLHKGLAMVTDESFCSYGERKDNG